jgi:hypothetical protein
VSHASHDQVVVASHAGRIYQRSSAEPDPKSTGIHGHPMSITSDYVREIFRGLKCGDGAAFFRHVADDVDWTVMGAHPFAGSYRSRAALVAGTFAKLAQVLPRGAQLHVEHLVVRDNQASVELHALVAAPSFQRARQRSPGRLPRQAGAHPPSLTGCCRMPRNACRGTRAGDSVVQIDDDVGGIEHAH